MRTILNAAIAIGLSVAPAAADELTVITAGDQNMVDYINQYLGPLFEKRTLGRPFVLLGQVPAMQARRRFSNVLKLNPRPAWKTGTPTSLLSTRNSSDRW